MGNIIINQCYFDNIHTAVDSINNFFSSDYRMKNFPVEEEMENLDGSMKSIIDYIRDVDLSYMTDEDRVYEDIEKMQEEVINPDPDKPVEHEVVVMRLRGIIGYFAIKFINDNFEKFNSLINGIYSFDLFLNTSQYRDILQSMTANISYEMSLESIVKTEYGTSDLKLFDLSKYVRHIFANPDISLGKLNLDDQIARVKNFQNLDATVEKDDTNSQNSAVNTGDDTGITEAADINFFTYDKPPHLKYDVATKRWVTSDQLHKAITILIEGLKKCQTPADLKNYFKAKEREQDNFPEKFAATIMPTILSKVFCDKKKYPFSNYNVDHMAKYSLSYKSIASKDRGANNFNDADIFDCFKTDRDSTIKFIEDFMRLNLVNDKNCAIGSKQLTIIFNIFDSRIYFDLMYNILPKDIKKQVGTEDDFVKAMRKRVNENSRKVYIYNDDHTQPEDATSGSVNEWTSSMLKTFGDYTLEEASYCGTFKNILEAEISTLDDRAYNYGVPIEEIYEAVECFYNEEFDMGYERPDFIQDRLSIKGEKRKYTNPNQDDKKTKKKQQDAVDDYEDEFEDIPGYMQNRINLTDTEGNSPNVTYSDDTDIPDYQDATNSAVSSTMGGPIVVNTTAEKELTEDGPEKSEENSEKKTEENSEKKSEEKTEEKSEERSSTDEKKSESESDESSADNNKNNDGSVNKYNNTESAKKAEDVVEKDDKNDKKETEDSSKDVTLSNGKTINEVFSILEAFHKKNYDDQPLPPQKLSDTVKNDNSDVSTFNPEENKDQTLGDKVKNFGANASTKFKGIKQKLIAAVNKLIRDDETNVKKRMLDNPSYRSAIFKITNAAFKLGMFGLAVYCNKWIGAAFAIGEIAKWKDKPRLNKELQAQYTTEIEILDKQIEKVKSAGSSYNSYYDIETGKKLEGPELQAKLAQLERERARLVHQLGEFAGKTFVARKSRPM